MSCLRKVFIFFFDFLSSVNFRVAHRITHGIIIVVLLALANIVPVIVILAMYFFVSLHFRYTFTTP